MATDEDCARKLLNNGDSTEVCIFIFTHSDMCQVFRDGLFYYYCWYKDGL